MSDTPPSLTPQALNPMALGGAVLKCLETTVWALRLYDIQNQGCQLQLQNLEQNLQEFFRHVGKLNLKLQYKEVFLKENTEAPLWTWDGGDSSLLHRLFMEGIQEISFETTLDRNELLKFLKLLAADYNSYHYLGEDVASMLWKANLKTIHHKTMEAFEQFDTFDLAEDGEKDRFGKFLQMLMAKLASPQLSQPELNEQASETSDKQPSKVEQLVFGENIPVCSTIKGKLLFVDAEDLQTINHGLESDRNHDFLPDVLQAVLEALLVEKNENHIALHFNYLLTIAEEFLNQMRWRNLVQLLDSLKAFGTPQAEALLDQLASEHRLNAIEKHLTESQRVANLEDLCAYLRRLPNRCARTLLTMVFRLPRGPVRRALLDVLVELGKGQEFLFTPLIEKLPNEELADLVYLFSRFDLNLVMPHLLRLAQDCTGPVKEEAMIALLSSTDAQVREMMMHNLRHLEDSSHADKIQKAAIRYFSRHKDSSAARELMGFTKEKQFEEHPLQEQMRYFMVLGEVGGKHVLSYFEDLLKDSGGLFGKKTAEIKKLWAISGLSKVDHPQAKAMIEQEYRNTANSPRVRSRAQSALSALAGGKPS